MYLKLQVESYLFQVSKERGEELAIEYGIKFMETSAKASINVEEAFFTLARDIKCKMEKRLVNYLFLFYNTFLQFWFFDPFEFNRRKENCSNIMINQLN